ncbi:hypothetical protein B9G69_002375 [Bdellovibrio sp. SKB1291214]|uniref:hypothetical protein n=1 Tax=Bdellovibrio sp. SKB1291214 TaxID=1732569 RepID=UPI000B515CC7|nr:hypothetical protein [Bdellovibrio sp. SKB1291214]UYL09418.1 hypothetical protein B9G69_002375 [Bdellovibrio sp. SKB1291214]
MIKSIALGLVGLSVMAQLLSFAPISSTELKIEASPKTAFKTEGACMSRILDKAPRMAAKEICRLG